MKRRVLFFMNSLYGGGAERVLQTLLNHFPANDYDITLYALNQQPLNKLYPSSLTYRYVFRQGGANRLQRLWYRIGNKIKLIIYRHLSPTWFYRFFIRGNYDVEIAFIEGYATRIISGSTNNSSRKIAWVHTDLSNNHWTMHHRVYHSALEERKCYEKFDNVICVAQQVKESMISLFPSVSSLDVIYNPIDIDAIRRAAAEQVELPPKPQGVMRLVTTGRLVQVKGYDRLLRVAKRLLDEGHKIELWILGEGDQRAALERQIADSGLGSCVRLWGFQRNPYVYLAASDIFVCSSRAEGYSLAIAEALVLGIPVVSTWCAGPNELLDDGRYGMLVANDDDAISEAGLHAAIARLLSESNLINHYRHAAIERGTQFSLATTISQVEEILA